MEPQDELQQLLDRQEALNQELKAKKKELQDAQRRQRANLQKQIRRAQARVSAAERKRRTRRLILMGSYLEHVTQDDPERKARLMKELDGFLERDRDRGLFDLPPNKENSDGNPAEESRRQAGENVIAAIGAQITELKAGIDTQGARIEAQITEIKAEIKAQTVRIDVLQRVIWRVIWPLIILLAAHYSGRSYLWFALQGSHQLGIGV